jgi:hypothetical protein
MTGANAHVDYAAGGVEGEDVAAGDRGRRVVGRRDLGEQAAGDHLADHHDGVDLAVEHVRGPVGRVGGDHDGVRDVDRTAWLRHEADQDHGRHERRKQDSATQETTNPPLLETSGCAGAPAA